MDYKKYLEENILSLNGKLAFVSGSTSGIGYYEALYLLRRGASVILGARNYEKAKKCKEEFLKENPNYDIKIELFDLSDFESIDNLISKLNNYPKIDIFINNAGVYFMPKIKTKQGYEITIGTNYLGTFYLTEKLIPFLNKDSYLINVTSITHERGIIDFDNFFLENKNRNKIYGASKAMISSYTCYLKEDERLKDTKVFLTHPGVCATNILRARSGGFSVAFTKLGSRFLKIFTHSPKKAALSIIYPLNNKNDDSFFIGPRIFKISGLPKSQKVPRNCYQKKDELYQYTKNLIKR